MPQRQRVTASTEFTTFGELLKYLRRRAQLTQTELATACGYNPSQISRLEKNQRVPDRATLLALFVPALDLEAEPEMLERFLELAASARGGQAMIDVSHPNSTPPKPLKNNLPAQLTPFIGRTLELDALALLLTDPDVRLVTILGAGGIGKTRLSIEAALRRNRDFADGVFFVPLASVSTSEYLVTAIAEVVKCKFYPGRTPRETLLENLHEASMLLVLDNFEHLLAGAELVSDILQSAPRLKILVTSRERLSLQAETLYRLEGMDFPDEESLGQSTNFSAVRLFVQAARRVQPSFSLDERNQAGVVQICQQVCGMPLAIELAAAWVDTVSVEEISQEIERSLDFLKTGAQDLPLRQRSIQTVFDASWQRLTPEECRICLWLSVFRGGFTRQAAQQVTGASIEILNSLLNKSLLHRETSGRFDVHELLRQYSETKLEALPREAQQARDAHALYYTQFIEKQWTLLQSPDARTAAEEMETDIGNVRVAWRFMVEGRRAGEIRKFIRVFWIYFDQKNRFDEGIALLEEAVKSLTYFSTNDDIESYEVALGLALSVQGNFYTTKGFPQRGEALTESGIVLLRKHTCADDIFIALVALWLTDLFLDKVETLKSVAQEALSIAQAIEEPRYLAGALFALGTAHLEMDEYDEAKTVGEAALKYAVESDDPFTQGICSGLLLARTARHMGHFEQAKRYYSQGIEYFEAADRAYYVCMASNEVVLALVASGDLEAAGRFLHKAMNFFVKNGIGYQIIATLTSAATLIAAQGQLEDAVKLLALVITHPAGLHGGRKQAQMLLTDLQTKLHPDVFATAYEAGKILHLETAAAGLLQELQSKYSLSWPAP